MDLIRNTQSLVAVFGHWPSFHDAEVISLLLTREAGSAPRLEAVIHVFEMSAESTERDYDLLNHTLVTLRFTGVRENASIDCCDEGNVIASLDLAPSVFEPDALRVEMPSIYGTSVSFTCSAAEVVAVQPWTAETSDVLG